MRDHCRDPFSHTSLAADAISIHGTEEQKEKYLRPLADGSKLGSFALTEPEAGTDAAGQQTKAVRDGDEWVLNGTKIFITNAEAAEIYVVFAMTDKAAGTRGISAFIVEKGTPGFSFGLPEKKMGIRGSSTCELILRIAEFQPKIFWVGKVKALGSRCPHWTAVESGSLPKH